jgi:P-type Cu+ transporter
MSREGRKVAIPVTGMSCAACSARVEKALSRTEGVSAASVNLVTGRATVRYDPDTVEATELVETVEGWATGRRLRGRASMLPG